MINILLAVLFALGLVTSGGITVAASQSATPEDVLYPVKIWSEDARLAVADPATASELAYQFGVDNLLAIQEMLKNGQADVKLTGPMLMRAEHMFEYSVQTALNQPDDKAKASMTAIKTRLQQQLSQGIEVTDPTDTELLATQDQMQTLLATTIEVTAIGEIDPVLIRQHDRDRVNDNATTTGNQLRANWQHAQPQDGETVSPIKGNPWLSITYTITTTPPYSFSYATPNLDGPRVPDQAGSGPGYNYGQP